VRLDCIETPVGLLIAGATHDAVVQLEFCDRQTMESGSNGSEAFRGRRPYWGATTV